MKNLLTIIAAMLFFSFIASNAIAQPAPPPPRPGYYVVRHCYTEMFPFPHSKCEWLRVRYNYRHLSPPSRRYTPTHPPRGPHPGHHPPSPGGRGPDHHRHGR